MSERLNLNDSIETMILKLGGGNPGGLNVCIELYKTSDDVDPDGAGGEAKLFALDTYGVYEHRIWMLYTDVCKENIVKTHAVLRATQLGIISEQQLGHAIDNRGAGIDIVQCHTEVCRSLPNFRKEQDQMDTEIEEILEDIRTGAKMAIELFKDSGDTEPITIAIESMNTVLNTCKGFPAMREFISSVLGLQDALKTVLDPSRKLCTPDELKIRIDNIIKPEEKT